MTAAYWPASHPSGGIMVLGRLPPPCLLSSPDQRGSGLATKGRAIWGNRQTSQKTSPLPSAALPTPTHTPLCSAAVSQHLSGQRRAERGRRPFNVIHLYPLGCILAAIPLLFLGTFHAAGYGLVPWGHREHLLLSCSLAVLGVYPILLGLTWKVGKFVCDWSDSSPIL